MATENAQVIYDVGNSLDKDMSSVGLMVKAISDLELLNLTHRTDDCQFGQPYPDHDVTVDRPKLARYAIEAIKIVLDRETEKKKEKQPSFLTDKQQDEINELLTHLNTVGDLLMNVPISDSSYCCDKTVNNAGWLIFSLTERIEKLMNGYA